MSNDDFEKRMEECMKQMTAMVTNLDERDKQITEHDRRIAENDRQIAELVEQGKATDERINALIAIVEKTFRRPDAE